MKGFSEIESLLILCFYKFDRARNTKGFLKRFNEYFGKDVGEQTLLYELSIIESADEAANMPLTDDRAFYRQLWAKYSFGTKIRETRELYKGFKNGKYLLKHEEVVPSINPTIEPVVDMPVQIPDTRESRTQAQKRSTIVKLQALAAAKNRCECNCGRELFIKKDGSTYTEAHHLIPLKYQSNFDYSLDVPANIVSLCPSCHRQLHFGRETEDKLEFLLSQRQERLARCGIIINYIDLLLMYR